MKKGKWSPVKEILFAYLAISKIVYWFDTIINMNQDTLGNVGEIVVDRLMSRDLPMVLGVIMFFFLEKLIYMKKSKQRRIKEHIMFYGIGYVALMGFNLFFFWVTDWDFEALGFSLIDAIIYGTVGYGCNNNYKAISKNPRFPSRKQRRK